MDNTPRERGTPLEDLETPCFIVEVDALESNYRVVSDTYRDTVCKMRQHTKNIKSPFLAKMQMDIGGSNGGVCTAKVAEAEIMVEGGITDILIPNQVVTDDKLDRVCALARHGDIKLCVDSVENVRDHLRCRVPERRRDRRPHRGRHVHGSGGSPQPRTRRGDRQGRHVNLPGVAFRGVMSHQNVGEAFSKEDRYLRGKETIDICIKVKDAVEAAGIPVEIVSSGETFCYDVAATIPGVTEVEGGSYALMSTGYGYMTEFQVAGKVLGTVVSTPRPGVAIGDVGMHSIAAPGGVLPTVDGVPGVEVESLHDDHIVLTGDGSMSLRVGDKFKLLPAHQDMLVNRWDQYVAIRDGVVEDTWDIPGRGCYH